MSDAKFCVYFDCFYLYLFSGENILRSGVTEEKCFSRTGTILCIPHERRNISPPTRRDARCEGSEAERAGVSHASESRTL